MNVPCQDEGPPPDAVIARQRAILLRRWAWLILGMSLVLSMICVVLAFVLPEPRFPKMDPLGDAIKFWLCLGQCVATPVAISFLLRKARKYQSIKSNEHANSDRI